MLLGRRTAGIEMKMNCAAREFEKIELPTLHHISLNSNRSHKLITRRGNYVFTGATELNHRFKGM